MKSLLIGNGLDIQFGGKEYLNSSILERAISNLDTNNFNKEVYPKEVGELLVHLYGEFNSILKGEYDKYAVATYELKSLTDLKRRYKKIKKIKYTDIGIEDYMFIHDLFCRKNKIFNPQQFEFREVLKRCILDSIYNNGKVNNISKNFPEKLKEFFMNYSDIFTTNYDKNIENFTGQAVNYLHGAFHILSHTYDKESFRNKLSDCPIKKYPVVKDEEHLFSTALMSFTGELKSFSMKMANNANQAIVKMVKGIEENPEIARDVESWKDSENELVRNMYETIMLKKENKELSFAEEYPIEKFKEIEGIIDIVGLSPNNDIHLFELINNNEKIEKVCFYYFDKKEILDIRKTLNKKIVDVLPVKKLWKEYC